MSLSNNINQLNSLNIIFYTDYDDLVYKFEFLIIVI